MKILVLTVSVLAMIGVTNSQDRRDTTVENTFFWKVTSPTLTEPSYLYGTIHKTCATDVWFSPLLLEILRSCNTFYNETIEHRILKDSAILIGNTKNGLKDYIGKNYFRSGKIMLEKYYGQVQSEQLDAMGTTEFGEKLIEANQHCRIISYDDSLYNLANQYRLNLRGLETIEEAQKYMPDGWLLTPDRAWLRNYLSHPGIYRRHYLRDITYYKNHDLNALYEHSAYTKSGDESKNKQNMIDGRNKLWIPRIEAAMKEGSCFFSVGCAHLPGFNGIITQLRKKGYTVTPLFYSTRNP
jgi:uncharacterized protein